MVVEGKIKWAKVNSEVDIFKGKEQGYSLNLYVHDDSLQKLKKIASDILEETKNDPNWECSPGVKPVIPEEATTAWELRSKFPFKKDKEGEHFVVFKTKHLDDAGKRRYVDVFDKTNGKSGLNKFDNFENIVIGNGSQGFVSFTISPYWLSSTNHGIKFFLNAVQITNFVPRGINGTAEGYGFEVSENLDQFSEDIPV